MEFPSNSILGRCWDSSGPTERVKQLSSESRFIPLPGLIGRCCGESFLPHFVGDTPPPTVSKAIGYAKITDEPRTLPPDEAGETAES